MKGLLLLIAVQNMWGAHESILPAPSSMNSNRDIWLQVTDSSLQFQPKSCRIQIKTGWNSHGGSIPPVHMCTQFLLLKYSPVVLFTVAVILLNKSDFIPAKRVHFLKATLLPDIFLPLSLFYVLISVVVSIGNFVFCFLKKKKIKKVN